MSAKCVWMHMICRQIPISRVAIFVVVVVARHSSNILCILFVGMSVHCVSASQAERTKTDQNIH